MNRYLILAAALPLAGCTTLTSWGTATMPTRTPVEQPKPLPTQAVEPQIDIAITVAPALKVKVLLPDSCQLITDTSGIHWSTGRQQPCTPAPCVEHATEQTEADCARLAVP